MGPHKSPQAQDLHTKIQLSDRPINSFYRKPKAGICAKCGKPFESVSRNRKYCDDCMHVDYLSSKTWKRKNG